VVLIVLVAFYYFVPPFFSIGPESLEDDEPTMPRQEYFDDI